MKRWLIMLTGALALSAGGAVKVANEASGGGLKIDPELDVLLQRADQFAQNQRYDLASELWQRVIDGSNDAVITRDEWLEETLYHQYRLYRPVQDEIESTLASLPAEALSVYRVRADGSAAALLAAANNPREREVALGEVVRRFFLSNLGDDAAYELSGIQLDRHEFLPALRLLYKVKDHYPDASVPDTLLLLRMSVAHAYSGDPAKATELLAELDTRLASDDPLLATRDIVASALGQDEAPEVTQRANQPWTMPFGNAQRTGRQADVPVDVKQPKFAQAWTQSFILNLPEELDGIIRQRDADEERMPMLLEAWKANDWFPSGQFLTHDGALFFKKDDCLVCLDADSGELRWLGFRNAFALDAMTRQSARWTSRSKVLPINFTDPVTVQYFADRIAQSMIIRDDLLISLEGQPLDLAAEDGTRANPQAAWYRQVPARTRLNFLVAYDTSNGKLQWRRTPAEKVSLESETLSWLGAPVPYGTLLLSPVIDNGALWIYALESRTGKTVWKKFLCDEEAGAVSPFSPPGIAVAGGEAYISSGAGLVFAVDALSGVLRWCVRYPRSIAAKSGNSSYYYQPRVIDGWQEDVIIPHGRHLVVMASDFNQLLVLDRGNGSLLWESARTPVRGDPAGIYCLGVSEGLVLVAGRKTVRGYRLEGGRLIWETPVVSFGRGMLTDAAVWIPTEQGVLTLDPATGKELGRTAITPVDGQPMGNLYSDGKRLYGLGLRRVYCFEPEDDHAPE
ncbi:MAG: outer membrane protein assembly factor BamB [Kiritimatiellia bacterium]|jgi:outer membrane protein assembly factor BamB